MDVCHRQQWAVRALYHIERIPIPLTYLERSIRIFTTHCTLFLCAYRRDKPSGHIPAISIITPENLTVYTHMTAHSHPLSLCRTLSLSLTKYIRRSCSLRLPIIILTAATMQRRALPTCTHISPRSPRAPSDFQHYRVAFRILHRAAFQPSLYISN